MGIEMLSELLDLGLALLCVFWLEMFAHVSCPSALKVAIMFFGVICWSVNAAGFSCDFDAAVALPFVNAGWNSHGISPAMCVLPCYIGWLMVQDDIVCTSHMDGEVPVPES